MRFRRYWIIGLIAIIFSGLTFYALYTRRLEVNGELWHFTRSGEYVTVSVTEQLLSPTSHHMAT